MSFSVPFLCLFISPLVLAVTTGAAVQVRRKELMSKFGDRGFAYIQTPFSSVPLLLLPQGMCETGEPCRDSFPIAGVYLLLDPRPVGRNFVPQALQPVWSRQC